MRLKKKKKKKKKLHWPDCRLSKLFGEESLKLIENVSIVKIVFVSQFGGILGGIFADTLCQPWDAPLIFDWEETHDALKFDPTKSCR